MKKLALVLIALVSMSACTKAQVGCAVQNTLVTAMSQGIATTLQCSNTAAIAASLNTAAAGLNMCPATASLSLPTAFCQPLVSILVSSVASTTIPAAWGCSAAVAQADITNYLLAACTGTPAPAASTTSLKK